MELVLDPAAMAGVIGMTALFGWALGRTQAGQPAANGPAVGAPPMPLAAGTTKASGESIEAPSACQQRAFEERQAIFDGPVALADLHDEVRSIRRDERILEQGLEDTGLMVMLARGEGEGCRYLGRIGQPTCPGPIDGTCHDGSSCRALGFPAMHSMRPDHGAGRSFAAH